jgi:hypothetical protein
MKIMWMSQHVPTKRQLTTLEALFPSYELIIDARAFDSADDIIARYRASSAEEIVVVAPLTVIRELVRRGIHPIWAEMRQIPCQSHDVEVRTKRRCYKFVRFKRVNGLEFKTSDIHPATATQHEKENPT